jgi:hypothetical protein
MNANIFNLVLSVLIYGTLGFAIYKITEYGSLIGFILAVLDIPIAVILSAYLIMYYF